MSGADVRRGCAILAVALVMVAVTPMAAVAATPHRVYLPAIQSAGGIVSGSFEANGRPVVAATVYLGEWLKDAKGRWAGVTYDRLTSPRTWTDEAGHFAFVGVPPGRYSLILDTVLNAYLLHDPITGGPLYVDLPAHGIVSMGELVYGEWPE